jgi:hypothetical protein
MLSPNGSITKPVINSKIFQFYLNAERWKINGFGRKASAIKPAPPKLRLQAAIIIRNPTGCGMNLRTKSLKKSLEQMKRPIP